MLQNKLIMLQNKDVHDIKNIAAKYFYYVTK